MKYHLTYLFVFIASICIAQKEDKIWLFGYDYSPAVPPQSGVRLVFEDTTELIYDERNMELRYTNASVCDVAGNLQFYTNGCYIANKTNDYILNSDNLNPGLAYTLDCINDSLGYATINAAMFLRKTYNDSIIYFFHIADFFQITPTVIGFKNKLYYTILDIDANNGLGLVTSKNNLVLSDTITYEGMHAVRHANGRDWWIVLSKLNTNQYWIVLFSDKGVEVKTQNIGGVIEKDGISTIVFSPDGSKMARFNPKDDLRIYDFDRCTGTLSNPVFIPMVNDADNKIGGGTAFSADGHYLYVSDLLHLWQFDMWASDIAASQTLIDERRFDGPCPGSYSIGFMELGPDGRIYSAPASGQRCMHRMARPERSGTACEFVQFYYEFEDVAYQNMPHFPNYRLGPVDGSACDTLGINNIPLAGWRHDPGLAPLSLDFTSVSWYEPTAWLWDFGDGGQSTERNPSHTFATAGPQDVCLTVSNQYGSDTKCKTVWVGTTANDELGMINEEWKVYPNPTTGEVWIRGKADHVRVFDQLGRVQMDIDIVEGAFSIADLPHGLYFVELWAKGKVLATQKILKQE